MVNRSEGGPVRGLIEFASSKPPTVVFLLCLLALAAAFFSISIYLHGLDHVADPDKLGWDSLLYGLAEFSYCVNSTLKAVVDSSPSTPAVVVSVPVNGRHLPRGGSFNLSGAMLRTAVHLSRLDNNKILPDPAGPDESDALKIVAKFLFNLDSEMTCLRVEASESILEYLRLPYPSPPHSSRCAESYFEEADVFVSSPFVEGEDLGQDICSGNVVGVVNLEYRRQPQWEVYLAEEDMEAINLHLMVTSAFLFSLPIVVVLFICLRGRVTKNVKPASQRDSSDFVPLSSEESP